MLARMIRRTKELQDSMLVIITDRVDLDKQIHETFKRVFPIEYTIAVSNLRQTLD